VTGMVLLLNFSYNNNFVLCVASLLHKINICTGRHIRTLHVKRIAMFKGNIPKSKFLLGLLKS
jgi:hypothetical protein